MQARLRTPAVTIALSGLLVVVGCGPAAAPSPTAAPSKPVSTTPEAKPTQAAPASKPAEASPAPARPAATASAAAKPSASPAAKPAASSDWKTEWDQTVAAANKEGKVVVAGGAGDLYRNAALPFQKAYPDIQLQFTGVQGSTFAPTILAERDAGQYLWDIHLGAGTLALGSFKPKGVLDPVRPALILPEILDDSKWLGGLADAWIDLDRNYIFNFEITLSNPAYVNRDLIPESELSSFDQLLDPKWKGKIISRDPRLPGKASADTGYVLMVKGEDWLRKFLAQDIVISPTGRDQMESIIKGRYPIGWSLENTDVVQFTNEGLMKTVLPLDPNSETGALLQAARGNAMLINKAPHPNAAKVFLNWLLSGEGQKIYVDETGSNSRRLDVDGPAATAPNPAVKYRLIHKEEYIQYEDKAREIAKELIK